MVWIGALIVIAAIVLLLLRVDGRMVLFLSGFLMIILSGGFLEAFATFYASFLTGSLPQIICSAMGYAFIMNLAKCDVHLCVFLVNILKKSRQIVIPGVIIATGVVIFALQSNAGTAAAVAPVFIPVMIKAGIHPAMAAAVLAAGASGSYWTYANPHTVMVAEIAGVEIMDTYALTLPVAIASYLILIIWSIFYSKRTKEDRDFVDKEGLFEETVKIEKINPYFAFLPFLPVLLVMLGAFGIIPKLTVQEAMLLCTIWAILTTRVNLTKGVEAFMKGAGRGLADVMSIIACAGVFTLGMETIGLTPALIGMMESNSSIAIYAAAIGPWLIATMSGTGNGATMAFNGSVTPLVASFGLEPNQIGVLAHLSGCFGRTMSPLAGVTIICAGFAKVSPLEIIKRLAVPSILSLVASIILLGYIL